MLSLVCTINDGFEDKEHFLLHCHSHDLQRNDLIDRVQATLFSCGLSSLSVQELVSVILHGDKKLIFESSKTIIKATLEFIESSKRFSQIISVKFSLLPSL